MPKSVNPTAVDTLLIIPARWGSKRFPGKPLTDICGKSLLERVYRCAEKAVNTLSTTAILIATEDERIIEHAQHFNVNAILTPDSCRSGTDRAYSALQLLSERNPNASDNIKSNNIKSNNIKWVINLQGDAPNVPAPLIQKLVQGLHQQPDIDVLTPVTALPWHALDDLRALKKTSPFSGTTAIVDAAGRALWFSKNILPAIRNEAQIREHTALSPVYRHIGLYGYKVSALTRFVSLNEGVYEKAEGLEQLRFLENDIPIHTITTELGALSAMTGIDTPQDAARMINWISKNGDPLTQHTGKSVQ